MNKGIVRSGIALVMIVVLVIMGVYQMTPPSPVAANAPATDFSADRAYEHLKVIAQKPHPTGSVENANVRNYLVQQLQGMGLTTEVQTAVSSRARGTENYFYTGNVYNIVARLKGTDSTKALMITGHYDSVPTGPGANDDGVAVASILETIRALKAGAPLKNDILFVLTDGEELGLLGAQAFWDESPNAKEVGMVVNLEARGSDGASLMFQTSKQNGFIVDGYAQSVHNGVASSLMGDIYNYLPNDTDMTVSNESGVSGLNFAYGEGWTAYHTTQDSLENVSMSSLQHHGENALDLARHFGNADLTNTKQSDRVYFSLFGSVITYPKSWSLPITIVATLLFLGTLILGMRRRALSFGRVLLGLVAVLASIIVSVGVLYALWLGVNALWAKKMVAPLSGTYYYQFFEIGFVLLTLVLTMLVWRGFRKRIQLTDLIGGGMLLWTLLTLGISFTLAGGSYLFAWPLLFGSLVFGFALLGKDAEARLLNPLSLLITAAPLILLWTPLVALLFIFMPVATNVFAMALIVLLLAMLAPHVESLSLGGRWLVPATSTVVAVALLVVTAVNASPTKDRPVGDNIFYNLNADSGKAAWVTMSTPDDYTSQYIVSSSQDTLNKVVPGARERAVWKQDAPSLSLNAPAVKVIDEQKQGNTRTLHVNITSPRQARQMMLELTGVTISDATLGGKKLKLTPASDQHYVIRHTGVPAEGLDLVLTITSQNHWNLNVTDIADNLPNVPDKTFKPRPDERIPSPDFDTSTQVTKTYKL